jgi:DNA topoisomerase VI subunit A
MGVEQIMSTPVSISPAASLVLKVLRKHEGANRAIKSSEITKKTGLSDRKVRIAVKELVEDVGFPVVGTSDEPYGFYIAATRDECEFAINSLKSRMTSMRRRVKALKNKLSTLPN